MDNVVEYSRRGAITQASVGSGGGGGGVDDIFKRLGNVETDVSELRSEVRAILATIPHLATAASVSGLRSEVAVISAAIPHLATAASVSEISAVIPHLATKADLMSMETKIIKWIIATTLTSAALAFSLAKFVH